MGGLSIIIPASNEAAHIGACLAALVESQGVSEPIEVIVTANACHDQTVAEAGKWRGALEEIGWRLTLIDRPRPGKTRALDAADVQARYRARVYLDADVLVSEHLIAGLIAVLARPEPAYASGKVTITGQGRAISRLYGRFWTQVPFMAEGVPGCGLFAVNATGRARWGAWPEIISDDTFARLHFTPAERHLVEAGYDWPVARGWANLVKVRRRQDAGVAEIAERWPELMANEAKRPLGRSGAARLALRDPAGFAVYAGVALATRRGRAEGWSRER